MKLRLVLATTALTLSLAACSSAAEEATPTETNTASSADAEICTKIAERTDDLYSRFDELQSAGPDNQEVAESGHWIGMERLNREMRRGAAGATDETLKTTLTQIADNDLSSKLVLREATPEEMEGMFKVMDEAKKVCGDLGLAVAEADTTNYPMAQ